MFAKSRKFSQERIQLIVAAFTTANDECQEARKKAYAAMILSIFTFLTYSQINTKSKAQDLQADEIYKIPPIQNYKLKCEWCKLSCSCS